MMARRPETLYPSVMSGNALAKIPETPPTPAVVRRGGKAKHPGTTRGWAAAGLEHLETPDRPAAHLIDLTGPASSQPRNLSPPLTG